MKNLTHTAKLKPHRWLAAVVLGAFLGCLLGPSARAQLAITEVMSDAATNCARRHPDFLEISNLGSDSVDLTDHRFWDQDRIPFHLMNPMPSTNIAPGESILFVRTSSTISNVPTFRAWWGENRLPRNLKIYFYDKPGFDGEGGDGVRILDAQTNLVDEVFFGKAVLDQGITFVNNPTNGEFGALSEIGVCGAFQAVPCDDVGSPGVAPCGPSPMRITQQPVNQTVDAGSIATFRVRATGLPRPRIPQWFHNGVPVEKLTPIVIPTVVNYAGCGLAWRTPPHPNDLVITNAQMAEAGQYYAVLTNGLECLTSSIVTLTVNTEPAPPQIICPSEVWWFPPLGGQSQTNLLVSRWQPATLDVKIRAYPPPTFRWTWSADGKTFFDIYETNRSLVFSRVSPDDAGIYRVWVANTNGTNYADAYLTVEPKPDLRITEAMPDACHGISRDWWELTNAGDEPVTLTGYRWDDFPGIIGGGPTVTNAVIIQPGESVILLESQTRASFIEWWGEENLPPHLQCVVYRANGLTEGDSDEINLWNQSAVGNGDFIDSVGFSSSVQGATFWFDWEFCLESEFGLVSEAEQCGAFRAANGCDVGSPGWTRWTPPCFTEIRREGSRVRLWWRAQPGSLNRIEFTRELVNPPAQSAWTPLGDFTFTGATGTITDPGVETDPHRFYRIKSISPANCNCP